MRVLGFCRHSMLITATFFCCFVNSLHQSRFWGLAGLCLGTCAVILSTSPQVRDPFLCSMTYTHPLVLPSRPRVAHHLYLSPYFPLCRLLPHSLVPESRHPLCLLLFPLLSRSPFILLTLYL
ncbi:hypothetical protein H4582DRAFT_2011157, partial [Lactarius indigo]